MIAKKIYPHEELKREILQLKGEGKRIVFTNGCFDILHVGHVYLLREAKKMGDVLVVAVNSDASIKEIKGEKRPIIPQEERLEMLAALEMVDYVTLFAETTPQRLIEYLRPDVLVKGGDWANKEVVGAQEVATWGGKVVIIPLMEGLSTSKLIERILRLYVRGNL